MRPTPAARRSRCRCRRRGVSGARLAATHRRGPADRGARWRCSTACGCRPNGMRDAVAHRGRHRGPEPHENARLRERNRTLAAEVRDLKEGRAAIEERARTELGMIGANETFFQVVPPAPETPPAPEQRGAAHRRGRSAMIRRERAGPSLPAAGSGQRFGGRSPSSTSRCSGGRVLVVDARARCSPSAAIAASWWRCAPGDRRFARLPEAREPRVRTLRGGARREHSVRARSMRWPAGARRRTGCWCTMPRDPACARRTCAR